MKPASDNWKMCIRYACQTDVGLRRANNQDSYIVCAAATARQWLQRGHLFVVADGMGAHVAGEAASRLAVDTIAQSYLKRTGEIPSKALVNSVLDAHRVIKEKSSREDAYRGMGTTCDAFALTAQGFLAAHVGDSRVYRVRNHCIEQLTFDHSLVWEVCAATNIPFDKSPSYIPKNQITRSLGPTDSLTVDLEGPFPVLPGDVFLACSDGLSGQITNREIGEIVSIFPPDIAAETLINLANLRGGPDNITVIIVQAGQNPYDEQAVQEELQTPVSAWLTLGCGIVAGIIGLFSFVSDSLIAGSISLLIAGFAFFLFFLLFRKPFFNSFLFFPVQPGGKAPYTSTGCVPSEGFAGNLGRILKELRQATRTHQLKVQSLEADRYERQAVEAEKSREYAGAIKNYALAINQLMSELKKTATPQ